MKNIINIFSLIFLLTCLPANAAEQGTSAPVDLPIEAFTLLAKAATQKCILCANKTRQDAFRMLENRFPPGSIIQNSDSCPFVSADQRGSNELTLTCYSATPKNGRPLLHFRFHSEGNKLVGVAEKDLTGKNVSEIYNYSPAGTLFAGELEIVPYLYGDGKTFNYNATDNIVQIHCKIRSLRPSVVR